MGRRKKKRPSDPQPPAPKAPEKLSRPFAQALRSLADERRAAPPAPEPGGSPAPPAEPPRVEPAPRARPEAPEGHPSWEDRVAMSQAFRGVVPLRGRKGHGGRGARTTAPERVSRVPASEADQDALARSRLAALVAGGIRFDVQVDEDGRVCGARAGADPGALASLRGGRARADAEIDLHGLQADEAEREVVRFVRARRGEGAQVVRIVHGKGLHSDGGAPVLADRVRHALTEGGAAPFVLAFTTAGDRDGGTGALLVRLSR